MQRINFYKAIHKAIRAMLSDLVAKSGRLDFTDAQALALFRGDAQYAFEFLADHAHHENEFVMPLVAAATPELAATVGAAHEDQDAEIAGLASLLARIDPMAADASQLGHEFVVGLARLTGDLLMHMSDEEQLLMPALWTRYTDEELLAVNDRIIASIPPEKLTAELLWLIPSINTQERIEMFAGAKKKMPPPVYELVRGLARGVLSAEQDEALEKGIRIGWPHRS